MAGSGMTMEKTVPPPLAPANSCRSVVGSPNAAEGPPGNINTNPITIAPIRHAPFAPTLHSPCSKLGSSLRTQPLYLCLTGRARPERSGPKRTQRLTISQPDVLRNCCFRYGKRRRITKQQQFNGSLGNSADVAWTGKRTCERVTLLPSFHVRPFCLTQDDAARAESGPPLHMALWNGLYEYDIVPRDPDISKRKIK